MKFKNKTLSKIINIFILLSFIFFLNIQIALAQPITEKFKAAVGETGYQVPENIENAPAIIIGRIILYALAFLGVIFLILMIYAGFLWMTAGGNEEKIKKAKKYIANAMIGLVIAVASYIITDFVISALTTATG